MSDKDEMYAVKRSDLEKLSQEAYDEGYKDGAHWMAMTIASSSEEAKELVCEMMGIEVPNEL